MATTPITELTDRAREIFRRVVEGYIETGQPVGSKTLAGSTSVNLSPASIRSVLADLDLLLLEEGHCLRDQALEVCRLSGSRERRGFRATSLETLRQMVAAGVGVTLLPELAVAPPVPASDQITLLRFTAPTPSRQIALLWRETSTFGSVLPELARLMAQLPPGLVRTA